MNDLVYRYGYSRVYAPDSTAYFCVSGLQIDADGSPRAYHPESSKGLDAIANAGRPGDWYSIATDNRRPNGNPIIQGTGDPAPGFFVSTTSLQNDKHEYKDPLRYIDSETVPFLVIPGRSGLKWELGDLAWVLNTRTGNDSFAIVADVGPTTHYGEGSICLANNLDIESNPRTGGQAHGVITVVFHGTTSGYRDTTDWIDEAINLISKWGGKSRAIDVYGKLGY